MSKQTHYEKVKTLTESAVSYIQDELDGNYKGYTSANAVSLYLSDTHGINVTCDDEANRAFEDVLSL